MDRIEVVQGDITKLDVDAIVNAANQSLLGGGGVDGAIHSAAGPELLKECRTLGGCATGDAKITNGYNLKAKWVIHTVGPIWSGNEQKESQQLAACYQNSLQLALEYKVRTIAFPCISTGVYRYPVEKASIVAIKTIMQFLAVNLRPEKVILVCFGEDKLRVYREKMEEFKTFQVL